MKPRVSIIGTPSETEHHVAPFADQFNIDSLLPEQATSSLKAGDLAIFFSEHFDRFRNCCIELKRKNIATLYMVDGILEWRNAWENRPTEPACPWTMRTALSHKVAVIGSSQYRQLWHWGNQEKLELVGIPRFEKLTEVFRRNEDFKPSGEKFRVMVATAKTPGFTDDQVAVTRQMLIDLRDCFASDSQSSLGLNVEVVWRIGPELAEELELKTVQGDLSGMELHDQLQNVDCVLTTPSTLMLESMLLQRPTALLNYHLCPTWVPAAWEISHRDAIVPVLKQLQNTALERLEWQRQIVRDHLQVETNATDRMVMLIESILEKSQKCVAEKTNLDLNEPILSPLIQYPTRMEWKRFYPEFNEFGFDSSEQLAAEWAQSRREIRHLQSELQQSRNELSEAHRIFEQIQNHPIAGPIVRIRQSFLDWVRSASKEKKSEST